MYQTYLALIRGINVGGKIVKMELLREYLSEAGFSDVQTYIQSGNIIFKSENSADDLAAKISQIILLNFGIDAKVIIRRRADLERVLQRNPFLKLEHKQTYNVFANEVVDPNKIEDFNRSKFCPDELVFDGDTIYIKYSTSAGTSKLTLQVLEKKLGIIGTMRNLNTTNKLLELLSFLEND